MSIRMKPHEAEAYKIFCEVMPEDLAAELVEYRRRRKAEATARIAKSLVERYKAYGNVEKAVEEQMLRNWIGFDPAWLPKTNTFIDTNNPIARQETAQERNHRLMIQDEMRWAMSEGNKAKADLLRIKLDKFANRVQ